MVYCDPSWWKLVQRDQQHAWQGSQPGSERVDMQAFQLASANHRSTTAEAEDHPSVMECSPLSGKVKAGDS